MNNILRLEGRQSYRILRATATGLIRSDYLLELLNRSRVGIKDPLSIIPSDLMKPDEVQNIYGVTKQKMHRWNRRRIPLPHFRINKHTVRYPKALLERWIEENSI